MKDRSKVIYDHRFLSVSLFSFCLMDVLFDSHFFANLSIK